jgi:hypothetical protein
MDEQSSGTMTAQKPSWQRWSRFFARTNYSDLELSAFMTAQGIHRACMGSEDPVVETDLEQSPVVTLVELPLTLASAAD